MASDEFEGEAIEPQIEWSLEYMRDIFEAGGVIATIDPATSSVRIQGKFVARALLTEERDRLRFGAFYTLKKTAPRENRLELANRINQFGLLVKSWIDDDGDLGFAYDLLLDGGVSAESLLLTTQTFLAAVQQCVDDFDADGIIA
jgi:hypothetical protein